MHTHHIECVSTASPEKHYAWGDGRQYERFVCGVIVVSHMQVICCTCQAMNLQMYCQLLIFYSSTLASQTTFIRTPLFWKAWNILQLVQFLALLFEDGWSLQWILAYGPKRPACQLSAPILAEGVWGFALLGVLLLHWVSMGGKPLPLPLDVPYSMFVTALHLYYTAGAGGLRTEPKVCCIFITKIPWANQV